MSDLIIESKGKFSIKQSNLVLVLFWIVIIFQFTELRYIWSVEPIGRLLNLSMLAIFSLIGVVSILTYRFNSKIWIFYIIPGLCIFIGMVFNISVNSLRNIKLMSFFGLALPWASFIIAPFLYKMGAIDIKRIWKHFYYFMLVIIIISLLEYFLVFAGIYPLRQLHLANGLFLAGRFTIFHMIDDPLSTDYGDVHYQFYACFAEAGTLAMVLLPAITYAILYKKYIGLLLFLVALNYSAGFGGFIGLLMLVALLPLFSIGKKYILGALVIFVFLTSMVYIFLGEDLAQRYEDKQQSRITREESFSNTISKLPVAILNYPLGFDLETSTGAAERNDIYSGSNFMPGYAFVLGGFLAFAGYLVVVFTSLWAAIVSVLRKKLTKEDKVIFLSIIILFPFIFQRSTVWDSAIFAFLFSPAILRLLDIDNKQSKPRPLKV